MNTSVQPHEVIPIPPLQEPFRSSSFRGFPGQHANKDEYGIARNNEGKASETAINASSDRKIFPEKKKALHPMHNACEDEDMTHGNEEWEDCALVDDDSDDPPNIGQRQSFQRTDSKSSLTQSLTQLRTSKLEDSFVAPSPENVSSNATSLGPEVDRPGLILTSPRETRARLLREELDKETRKYMMNEGKQNKGQKKKINWEDINWVTALAKGDGSESTYPDYKGLDEYHSKGW